MSKQGPGGKTTFSFGWGADTEEKPATTSVKVHHTPGGASSIFLGGDNPEPAKVTKVEDAAGAHQDEETGGVAKEAEGDEEAKEEKKEEPVAEAPKKTSGGILPGMNDDKPHTSVKVRAPPGGKSSITF
uniref:Uncharacterized protein n=1 Tax=Euplotes harpa TaxID=151035 RepID=A0A7S3J5G6_9SPIT